jgi:transcriptional regulator with XRE-family HTH domain
MNAPTITVGDLLRDWRRRRRMSQLDLALEAEISARHLSFVESGRSRPSREMLLHLCEMLAVPLRERNAVLLAAGYAPVFPKRSMDDPALKAAYAAIDRVLTGHEPLSGACGGSPLAPSRRQPGSCPAPGGRGA